MRSAHPERVFFFLSAGWGPVVRTLPIIHRLADRGIASAVAIGGDIGAKIRAAGCDVIELRLPASDAPTDEVRNWWSPYHYLAFHNVDSLFDQVNAYRKVISDGHPAVVVTDINPVAALAARALRVPHITISQSVFLPQRRTDSRRFTIPSALPAIEKVLARYGTDRIDSAVHLELGEVTLVPSIPELDPLEDAPPSVRYVGPILGNQLVPLHTSPGRPPAASGGPEIFVYPGRPHDGVGPSGQALLNVALSALRDIKATATIATGGFEFEIPEYAGDQVEIVPWRVISPAYKPDLIIHHGGHGACLTALSAGIPSVIVPTHAEREYNASHLAAMGCGDFVAADQIDVPRVRHAIESVLNTPAYAGTCTQWSETIAARAYGGADLAARLIVEMIETHSAGTRRNL
jgi:UDP:flavonoid glycosyltransferase YjiC (YdhE family)